MPSLPMDSASSGPGETRSDVGCQVRVMAGGIVLAAETDASDR